MPRVPGDRKPEPQLPPEIAKAVEMEKALRRSLCRSVLRLSEW